MVTSSRNQLMIAVSRGQSSHRHLRSAAEGGGFHINLGTNQMAMCTSITFGICGNSKRRIHVINYLTVICVATQLLAAGDKLIFYQLLQYL